MVLKYQRYISYQKHRLDNCRNINTMIFDYGKYEKSQIVNEFDLLATIVII